MSIQNNQDKQKIVPHLWFDKEAKEAAEFYVSLLPDSKIKNINTIKDTPSGDCDIVSFNLAGLDFMSISAGPVFKLNPAISFSLNLETTEDVQRIWDKLVEGGKVLMPLQKYPFSEFYGWLNDKYGVSWQLIVVGEEAKSRPTITPALMFTQDKAGKAEEAMNFYTGLFPDSKIDGVFRYEANEGPDKEGTIAHAVFHLNGQEFMALDSAGPHAFIFNEAVSFIVNCETQEEVDMYWDALSAVPEAEQCGWLKDKYGVSWQIVPTAMNKMMASGDSEASARVTQAFLKMKKFDIAKLEEAFKG